MRVRHVLSRAARGLTVPWRHELEFAMTYLCEQVRKGRLRSLVSIHAGGMQAIAARARSGIDERQSQTIAAMKPISRPMKGCQVFVLADEAECGKRGVGHGDGFNGLLIVDCLRLPVRVPAIVPDGLEEVLRRCFVIEKGI